LPTRLENVRSVRSDPQPPVDAAVADEDAWTGDEVSHVDPGAAAERACERRAAMSTLEFVVVGSELSEDASGQALAHARDPEQQVLAPDMDAPVLLRLSDRKLERLLRARREAQGTGGRLGRAATDQPLLKRAADCVRLDTGDGEEPRSKPVFGTQQPEQDVSRPPTSPPTRSCT
jgi:hypothetical protein